MTIPDHTETGTVQGYKPGTIVEFQAWYIERLEELAGRAGSEIWLPSPGDLGVVLFQSGTGMVVAVVDAGPGFTITNGEDVFGAIIAPAAGLTAHDGSPPESFKWGYGKAIVPLTIRSDWIREGGTAPIAVTLRLMGVKSINVARAMGVSRQYIHASVSRLESKARKYKYAIPRRKDAWIKERRPGRAEDKTQGIRTDSTRD